MIFVVKSALTNFHRRQAIRQTWGSVKVFKDILFQTVFVVGDTFENEPRKRIAEENRLHGDILQFNIKDTVE